MLVTGFALLAFAANSILCRMALRDTSIDPASFTSVRIVAGAITLWILVRLGNRRASVAGTWISSFALLAYAIAFSFAYVAVTAGTGALLLFGAVQLIMISAGLAAGERIDFSMLCAGAAWGVYSLRGRRSSDPLRDTAGNFARAVPGALLISAIMWRHSSLDRTGMALAALSGSLASGVGYAAWYTALPRLRAIAAANLQLSVPLITSLAGVVLFAEPITVRLASASVLLLGGIALATRHSIKSRAGSR